jgi:hypothetical protein
VAGKKIGPIAKGRLHANLGIPSGEKIGKTRLQAAKNSASPAVRKEANFALNMAYKGGGVVQGVPHLESKVVKEG